MENLDIKRHLSKDSKINSFDFENIKFGESFTDHMLVCEYENGKWQTPEIKPYAPFTLEPSARVFHYGQAIFEGMKAYKDEQDDIWLFRPEKNFERFNKSAERLCMPTIPEEIFIGGLKALVDIERNWVKKGKDHSLYLRPFMIASQPGIIANPSEKFIFCIICSPAKSYYSGTVKVKIAQHYSRAANGGIGAAKAAGNYSAQFYPTMLAQQKGYNQVIWTDDATHTKLEEAGTMNVFFRINDTLYTAPTSERILDGVTRKSLLKLCEHVGIQTEVKSILVNDLIEASKNGTLKEIFGAGTAAVISRIEGFSYDENYYELPKLADEDSYALRLKELLTGIQNKSEEDIFNWTVKVEKND